MKVISKKTTRNYQNGAIINFMKWHLSSQYCKEGHCAYYWKKGDLLWSDNEDESNEIIYFKGVDDPRTDEEINELLKKQVKLFWSFYEAAKKIVLKDWDEIRLRYIDSKSLEGKEREKELECLITLCHVYWIEHNDQRAHDLMAHIIHLKNASKNSRALRLVGLRNDGKPAQQLFTPSELGYSCPICGSEDGENLQWSEYASFLWCKNCNLDIPSCLCTKYGASMIGQEEGTPKEKIMDAIGVFLDSVEDAVRFNIKKKSKKVEP